METLTEDIQIDIEKPESDRIFHDNSWSQTSLDNTEQHIQEVKEYPFVKVSHIDFIFGDQQWKLGDCKLIM